MDSFRKGFNILFPRFQPNHIGEHTQRKKQQPQPQRRAHLLDKIVILDFCWTVSRASSLNRDCSGSRDPGMGRQRGSKDCGE